MLTYRPRSLMAVSALLTSLALSSALQAATITKIDNFGSNPTGIGMYLYTPSNVVSKPPILVGVHACHGKGLDVCANGAAFAQQADKYGFLMICPSAVSSDGCWDVHSKAVLTHNGGGDAGAIVSMVNWVVQNKNGDRNRVYAAGHSSGGMMTNVLLGSYPDLFKAGAAFAGVPFACFAQGAVDNGGWNTTCATGKVTLKGTEWGDLVRAAYPDYTGPRPRMQVWHGTMDAVLNFHNFGEEIKEWTNVLGVSETPATTENNAVRSGWIRTRYKDASGVVRVEAVQETGQPHNLVLDGAEAAHFFGLDGSNPDPIQGGSGSGGKGGAGGTAGTSHGGGAGGNGGSYTAAGSSNATGGGGAAGVGGEVGVGGITNDSGAPGFGGSSGSTDAAAGAPVLAGSGGPAGVAGGSLAGSFNAGAGTNSAASDDDEGCSVNRKSSPRGVAALVLGCVGFCLMVRKRRSRASR